MKKTRSRLLLTGAVLLMCTLLAGCGCGKKKAAARQKYTHQKDCTGAGKFCSSCFKWWRNDGKQLS